MNLLRTYTTHGFPQQFTICFCIKWWKRYHRTMTIRLKSKSFQKIISKCKHNNYNSKETIYKILILLASGFELLSIPNNFQIIGLNCPDLGFCWIKVLKAKCFLWTAFILLFRVKRSKNKKNVREPKNKKIFKFSNLKHISLKKTGNIYLNIQSSHLSSWWLRCKKNVFFHERLS